MTAVLSTALLSLFTSFAAPHEARAERPAYALTEAKTAELNAYRAKYKAVHEAKLAERAERATRKAERPERAERSERRADRSDRGERRGWDFCDALGCNGTQVTEIEAIRATFKHETAGMRASMDELRVAIRDESRSESPNDGAIRGMTEKLAAMHVSLHAATAEMHSAVLAVLTDGQRARLEAMTSPKAERTDRRTERRTERKAERTDRRTERKAERTDRKVTRNADRRVTRNADRMARPLERRPERPPVAPVSRDRMATRR